MGPFFLDVLDAFSVGCQAVGTEEVDGEVVGEAVGTSEGAGFGCRRVQACQHDPVV